jgi:hypothetical protein
VAIKDVTPEVAVRLGSLDSNDRSIEFLLDVVLTDKKGMLGCGYGSHFKTKHPNMQQNNDDGSGTDGFVEVQ